MKPWLLLLAFFLFYAAGVFPFVYFRHDDWITIGNSVLHLPEHWAFLWSDTQFHYPNVERIWFFRPGPRLLVYGLYQIAGYDMWIWLTSMLVCTLGTFWLSYLSIRRLSGSEDRARLFLFLAAVFLPMHFGSLTWMAAGTINCPKLLLLALCTYAFIRAAFAERFRGLWMALSTFTFIAALGFKESAVFHVVFLGALALSERSFKRLSWRLRALLISPIAAAALVYLSWRLSRPLNQSYAVVFSATDLLRGLYFVGILALPWSIWFFAGRRNRWERLVLFVKRRYLYFGFVGIAIAPYFGHPFFSLNWFFYVTYFWLWVVACAPWGLSASVLRRRGTGLAMGFAGFSFFVMSGMLLKSHWFEWHLGDRQLHTVIKELDPKEVRQLVIEDCSPLGQHAERVLGDGDAFYYQWKLTHGTEIRVFFEGCNRVPANRHTCHKGEPGCVWLRWTFPEIRVSNS